MSGTDSSGAPVSWFQSPTGPNNGPRPQLEEHIYQPEGKQQGTAPQGSAWIPQNPTTTGSDAASAQTQRTRVDDLFPSQKPMAPVFHSNK